MKKPLVVMHIETLLVQLYVDDLFCYTFMKI
ncbi:MAG: hypothetical protein ACJAQX_002440 [Polaribacter sp.]|jgi:hypothetical protein